MAKAKRKTTTAERVTAPGVIVHLKADDLIAGSLKRGKPEVERAMDWLRKVFPGGTGPRKPKMIQSALDAETEKAGAPLIERDSLRRARRKLGPPYI
jgi:hypothetical protein